jgi:hypothetical protein
MSVEIKAAESQVKRQWGGMTFPQPVAHPDYIGDGVYVGTDGAGIVMVTQRTMLQHWIYLEPEVLRALVRYANRVGIKP